MVRLKPSTEPQYQKYLEAAIPEYTRDHIKDGLWTEEEALQKSREAYQQLLPDGLDTPNHYLWAIHDELHGTVGMIWHDIVERHQTHQAFIYDFRVAPIFGAEASGPRRCRN